MEPSKRRRFRVRKRRYREASKVVFKRRRRPVHPALWIIGGLMLVAVIREVLLGEAMAAFLLAIIILVALYRFMRSQIGR